MVDGTLSAAKPRSVQKLDEQQQEKVAELLAAAFSDNPCYASMHPRVATRRGDLEAFFRRNLAWHASLELTWVVANSDGPLATATLEPPGGVPFHAGRALAIWLWPTLRQQGFDILRRILLIDAEFQHHYGELAGGEYWHVHAVAVSPGAQGSGIGTLVMTGLLEELARLRVDRSTPVLLSTQRAINIPFYTRLGFRLVSERELGRRDGHSGFHTWFMRLDD